MTPAEKRKYNLLVKENEELKKKVEYEKSQKGSYYKDVCDLQREINSIHAALDVLPGLPAKSVKIDQYSNVDLTVTARLFAWISHISFGGKISINEGDE